MGNKPRLVVFSTLFPNSGQPNAGIFIRERMFRVAHCLPLIVVAPAPWFPLQGLIRIWRPHFRPKMPRYEVQQGIEVYHPRFLSVPGFFKGLDGLLMALGSYFTLLKITRRKGIDIIDAHFAYPDGYAATLLGSWFKVPVTVTLRGTEVPHAKTNKKVLMLRALDRATHVFSVSESLKQHVIRCGANAGKITVVGNGVDTEIFHPLARHAARQRYAIPQGAKVLITVGGLVERKGFHRVIECLPELRRQFPDLHYLIVGGASAEGDYESSLRTLVKKLNLQVCVHFLGMMPLSELKWPLSSSDVFVLATRNEGWANVILEAMACGLPVVTTRVGGNAEVVVNDNLGCLITFGEHSTLCTSLSHALMAEWDHDVIIRYAKSNGWDKRVVLLVDKFVEIHAAERTRLAGLSVD